MDYCDAASEYEAVFLKSAMINAHAVTEQESETGYCLYCGAKLDHPGKFCDADCRDDYEHEQKVMQIAGKR